MIKSETPAVSQLHLVERSVQDFVVDPFKKRLDPSISEWILESNISVLRKLDIHPHERKFFEIAKFMLEIREFNRAEMAIKHALSRYSNRIMSDSALIQEEFLRLVKIFPTARRLKLTSRKRESKLTLTLVDRGSQSITEFNSYKQAPDLELAIQDLFADSPKWLHSMPEHQTEPFLIVYERPEWTSLKRFNELLAAGIHIRGLDFHLSLADGLPFTPETAWEHDRAHEFSIRTNEKNWKVRIVS